MSQPTPFVPGTDYSTELPGNVGNGLDQDFTRARTTFDDISANLALIQRDDGQLKNASVHPDALSASTLALIAGTFTPRGAWVTLTAYVVGDLVENSGSGYVCAVAHTSGTFATDHAAGKWVILFTPTTLLAASAGGTVDAITAALPITALTNNQSYFVSATGANTSTTPTLNPATLGAKTIVKFGNQALLAGDIVASGHVMHLVYRSGIDKFELMNPGILSTTFGKAIATAASYAAMRTLLSVPSTSETILNTMIAAKGDLVIGTADDTPAVKSVGSDGDMLVPSSSATGGLTWASQGFALRNGTITASVASNILTIALKTDAGADPSDADPVFVAFRSSTLGTGTFTTRKIVAAMSISVPNTATLGTVNAVAHRIYVTVSDNAGSLELGVYNPYNPTNKHLLALDEATLYSTTAVGVASDSAHVLYTTSALTSKAIAILGYVESTQATAGTWATTPSRVQNIGPGVKRTGDVIQAPVSITGAVATGTTTVPADDTIPQNTEGDQYMTLAVTPTNAANLLQIEVLWLGASSVANGLCVSLYQDTTADALASSIFSTYAAAATANIPLEYVMLAGTASSTTFKVRAGGNAAGTTTFNGFGSARKYGGVLASKLKITEIFV